MPAETETVKRLSTAAEVLVSAVEKIPVTVYPSSDAASKAVAREIAELIRDKAARGETAVLGLATGSTPTGVYDELVRLHKEEGLSFKNVVTFNLDEYYPMKPDELQSYDRFMREHLFDHIDIDPANVARARRHDRRARRSHEYCQQYERQIRDAGGHRLPDPGHRPHGARRVQRARLAARQPHAADHARQGHAHGRRQRLLRRVERAAQGDHDGRRHDHGRAKRRADGVGRAQGAGHPPGRRGRGHGADRGVSSSSSTRTRGSCSTRRRPRS